MPDPLDAFSPAVRLWFRETFGEPTPPQSQGWPPIQRGEHTLILAPTGSGKTLAAFLWGIDRLYREGGGPSPTAGRRQASGVSLVYVSPLKALNNDIERNLRVPLEGIRAAAARLDLELPALRVAVRTGDTPSSVRAAMLKHPPHILITTPESLYLMLTSPRAREMFRTVRGVIVDEIHTLSGSKRGAHLALSLERLCHLAGERVQRIGLSATIQPLEEAARFLGGQEHPIASPLSRSTGVSPRPEGGEEGSGVGEGPVVGVGAPRPVTIVNAHYRKPLELDVVTAVADFRALPGDTIWPAIIPRVLDDIRRHHTTLVFSNNRRLAERTADRLNAQLAAEQSEEVEPGSPEALAPGGIPRDRGIFAIGAEGPIRAHHGSMSKEARRQMEEDLKAGRLPALVGTSSLELGIDIGAVDLVVQLQSPKSVAQGLQRVGRSGHLVGETSRGKIYPTFREDLMEAAAIARGMLEGDVEPTFTPENPLDVLAQQIVAMVAVEDWSAPALYDLVRQSYPYRDLSPAAWRGVLEMLAGKYYLDAPHLRPASALRAKIAWDRVNDRLSALPGSRLLALSNVGTIPDTGAYGVYLGDGKTKVGELDEEFVYETRVGDVFLLGSSVWRVHDIADDRIIVGEAAGATPRMPFWHGDYPWRPYELGARIGKFRREIGEKIREAGNDPRPVEAWLRGEYALDENSARNLVEHVGRQLEAVGVMSSDTTIVVESFQNAVGDPHLVVHSPFGGRVNGAWALALSSALRERTGVEVETQANDDGIILRFPQSDREPPLEIVKEMTPGEARARLLRELPQSAVFGAHFRMNAARALLLSKPRAGKRTPFWLQRLKARDLLALVGRFDDFPIVAETYRDCLRDVLDLPHLEEILSRIQRGEISVVPLETVVPSPVASSLLFNFVSVYMYEWDAPKAERQLHALSLRREVLEDLVKGLKLSDLLKPEAAAEIAARAQHLAPGYQARSAQELALYLEELGDLTTGEIVSRSAGDGAAWIAELSEQGRVVEIPIRTLHGAERRWVPVELAEEYRSAFSSRTPVVSGEEAGASILRRFLRSAGPVTRGDILDRYAFPEEWLDRTLARLVESHDLVRGRLTAGREADEFCDEHLLEQIHGRTLTILRREVQPVSIYAYADFLARWQHVDPARRLGGGEEGLRRALQQLRGCALPGVIWERDVLPARLVDYDPGDLEALCASGELVWAGSGRDPRRGRVRLFFRGEGALFLGQPDESELSAEGRVVYDYLKSEGASFATELQAGLESKPDAIRRALVELAMAGLVTNDSAEALRRIMAGGAARDVTRERRPLSSLETDLAARRPSTPLSRKERGTGSSAQEGRRPVTPSRYYDAKRRVAQRLRAAQDPAWGGRWSLVHRIGVMGPPLSEEGRALQLARVLLARYGVVTRECLEHEEGNGDWSLLYPQFQRMELRGEARRGYFVSGLAGLQYALPEAVEQLRTAPGQDEFIALNAADPANLFGGELAGVTLRFARVPSTFVVLLRGQPVLLVEENGERITTPGGFESVVIERALRAYLARPNASQHVTVKEWNGKRVAGSEGLDLLARLGFYGAPGGMEWWKI